MIMQKMVKTDKNSEINKQFDVKFWLDKIEKDLELSHIY